MAWGESLALAIVEASSGQVPSDVDALWQLVSLHDLVDMRAPCPAGTAAQCWSSALALPAFGGDVARGRAALARLARHGVRITRARSRIACANVLNSERARLGSRVGVDLSLFEQLTLDAREPLTEDLEVVLGMVGGIRDYPSYFDRLKAHVITEVLRDRNASAYRIGGIGTLSFEIDADARHLPVALASMLGKYVRELWMERQNRFYASHDERLPRFSGYHDPVTKRFVTDSAPLRKRLGIVDLCFER
jgi:hypothetical protein